MAPAWIERGTMQHDGMGSNELMQRVVHYAMSVQANCRIEDELSGTQPMQGRLYPIELHNPCDEAVIADVMQKHRDGLARLARR